MELQRFVTEVIEAAGGVVIPVEYALCQVLVPEEYKNIFQGREELVLAFDYETAQENPGAEFVTFGCYLLDQLIQMTRSKAVCIMRYGVTDKLSLSDPEGRIRRHVCTERAEVKVLEGRPVMGMWIDFVFRISYISDERMEEVRELWIDLTNGEPSPGMEKINVFYEEKPLYTYPAPDIINVDDAFRKAYGLMKEAAAAKARKIAEENRLDKEIERITDYYEDLQEENNKRMGRKGISEEHIAELASKGQALIAERDRQVKEMTEKYTVKTEIMLEHGIIYAIPRMEYKARISHRGETKELKLYYNPLTKEF